MILFWVLTFAFLSTVLQDKVYATIKVDNEFSLSYPLKFKINTPAWQDKSFGKVSVNAINNFVDIWQLNVSLEKFLSSSLKTSTLGFMNFSEKNIISNNLTGILWEYNIKG